MEDKFLLVRKQRVYCQSDKYPKVRISAETYEKIAHWASETGLSLSELIGQAVNYAERHMMYIEE